MSIAMAAGTGTLSRRIPFTLWAPYPESWLTGNGLTNVKSGLAKAGLVDKATPLSQRPLLSLHSLGFSSRTSAKTCSILKKLVLHGPGRNDILSQCCGPSGISKFHHCGSAHVARISSKMGLSSSLTPHGPLQSKSSLEQVEHVMWVCRGSASSRNKLSNTRKGFLDLRSCRTVEEATDKAFRILDDLNPRSLAAFWSGVSRLVYQQNQRTRFMQQSQKPDPQQFTRQLLAIFSKTMQEIDGFGQKDLVQTALGFAKIAAEIDRPGQSHFQGSTQQILHEILIGQQAQHQKLSFQSIANASARVLSKFDARHLCNLAYANATVDLAPTLGDGSALFDHIAERSISLLKNVEPQTFSNLVWSFEKVGAPHPRLFENVTDHIVGLKHLGKFNPRDFSTIALAFTKAGESNQRLFKKIADHIVSHGNLREFKSQECSNLLWAFAKAEKSHPRLFTTMADHIAMHDNLYSFNSQELANTTWAFEKARVSHPQLFQKVADHIVKLDHLGTFKPQAFSNIVLAYVKSGETNQRLFKKIADHIATLDDLHKFDPQALSNIVWAVATAGESHPRLFTKIANYIVALEDFHKFNAQDLSNTVWAYAKAGESHPRLFKTIADHILALDDMSSFGAPDCAQILSAYASAKIIIPTLFEKVAKHGHEHIDYDNLDNRSKSVLLSAYEMALEAEKSLTGK